MEILDIKVALDTLRTNDKYREEFIVSANDVKADVVSFTQNPNCSCKGKIVNYINANITNDPLKTFFSNWKNVLPNLYMDDLVVKTPSILTQPTKNGIVSVEALSPPSQKNPIVPGKLMSGHVVEIPPSPAEYKALLDHAKNDKWLFRGLTVLERTNNENKLVWNIFFY